MERRRRTQPELAVAALPIKAVVFMAPESAGGAVPRGVQDCTHLFFLEKAFRKEHPKSMGDTRSRDGALGVLLG